MAHLESSVVAAFNEVALPLKRCSNGDNCVHPQGPMLPATPEFFHKHAHREFGVANQCKLCKRAWDNENYKRNRDEIMARASNHYADHREAVLERVSRYYKGHRQQKISYAAAYRIKNIGSVRQRQNEYRLAHPGVQKAARQRRRARKHNLPNNFSTAEWLYAVESFHGACAYCENPPSLFDKHKVLHADHFIPLSDAEHCPGTVKENMLPACQTCNMQKGNKPPHDWIVQRFGKRKAAKIEARIQAYFATLSQDTDTEGIAQ